MHSYSDDYSSNTKLSHHCKNKNCAMNIFLEIFGRDVPNKCSGSAQKCEVVGKITNQTLHRVPKPQMGMIFSVRIIISEI